MWNLMFQSLFEYEQDCFEASSDLKVSDKIIGYPVSNGYGRYAVQRSCRVGSQSYYQQEGLFSLVLAVEKCCWGVMVG